MSEQRASHVETRRSKDRKDRTSAGARGLSFKAAPGRTRHTLRGRIRTLSLRAAPRCTPASRRSFVSASIHARASTLKVSFSSSPPRRGKGPRARGTGESQVGKRKAVNCRGRSCGNGNLVPRHFAGSDPCFPARSLDRPKISYLALLGDWSVCRLSRLRFWQLCRSMATVSLETAKQLFSAELIRTCITFIFQ